MNTDEAELYEPTLHEAELLTQKYKGRTFEFHSPFEGHFGWVEGDIGIIVRLMHPDTDDIEETFDLWLGRNTKTKEEHALWGLEAFHRNGDVLAPLIKEHAAINWAPT